MTAPAVSPDVPAATCSDPVRRLRDFRLQADCRNSRSGFLGCGRSSEVEHNLAKVGVVGSNPIARSRHFRTTAGANRDAAADLHGRCSMNRIPEPNCIPNTRTGSRRDEVAVGCGHARRACACPRERQPDAGSVPQ